MPLIGTFRRLKNTTTRSLLDLMKPYQSLYNILINQIWQLLDKEIGVVFLGDIKVVPKKDSEDPIETMLWEAKEKGTLFIDTSLENTGGNLQFNQMSRLDLTRSGEIKDRLDLALNIRDICWEMIGVNRQRMGSTTSSETATAINTALSQSYSQTELWFLEHEYLMDRVTQSLLDTAQYIELKKPESTLNYLNSELDNVYLKISRGDLLRKLFIFTTSSNDDRNVVNTMKELAQPAMQNGAELTDIFDIMYSDSERKIKDILDDIKIRKDKMIQEQNELKRQEMEQQQQQFQTQMEQAEAIRKEDQYYDAINTTQTAIDSYYTTKDFAGNKGHDAYWKDFRWLNVKYRASLESIFMSIFSAVNQQEFGGYKDINTITGGTKWEELVWNVSTWGNTQTDNDVRVSIGNNNGKSLKLKFTNKNTVGYYFDISGISFLYNIKGRR
jgi:hypothetical protein